MGGGSLARQYQRRFHQGEELQTFQKMEEFVSDETIEPVNVFGKYEVYRTADFGYELVVDGVAVGSFAEARVEENRILFSLSHGMLLEVSEKGTREILNPAKAMLCGLIASDGGLHRYKRYNRKTGQYYLVHEADFDSTDKDLIEIFCRSSENIYKKTPHLYIHEKAKGKRHEKMRAVIYDKEIFYDLYNLGAKTGPYEFHVPREHLDKEGLRAYLRGFFSGDGNLRERDHGITIRLDSTSEKGLEELRQAFIDLGFHPCEIGEYKRPRRRTVYCFFIPAKEHMRFIEEIGSDKPRHVRIFKERMKTKNEL